MQAKIGRDDLTASSFYLPFGSTTAEVENIGSEPFPYSISGPNDIRLYEGAIDFEPVIADLIPMHQAYVP